MSARELHAPKLAEQDFIGPSSSAQTPDGAALMRALVDVPASQANTGVALPGVLIGELLALADQGNTALVRWPGHSTTERAKTTVDLQGMHIGHSVVLVFANEDPTQPIVMGVLRGAAGWPMAHQPAQIDVDADGQRLVVNAKEQLVLRCGKASITLTKAGKVLVEGSYVLSRSTGVNRIKGGSVQLN
jgi:Domain of unknown function (DUF6484)